MIQYLIVESCEILRDTDLFDCKYQDNIPRIRGFDPSQPRAGWSNFSFNQHNPFNPG